MEKKQLVESIDRILNILTNDGVIIEQRLRDVIGPIVADTLMQYDSDFLSASYEDQMEQLKTSVHTTVLIAQHPNLAELRVALEAANLDTGVCRALEIVERRRTAMQLTQTTLERPGSERELIHGYAESAANLLRSLRPDQQMAIIKILDDSQCKEFSAMLERLILLARFVESRLA